MAAKQYMLGSVEEFVAEYEPRAHYCDFKGEFLPTLSGHKCANGG